MKFFITIAGLSGAASVGLGAFAAHGLEKVLLKNGLDPADIPQRLEWAATATQYLLVHAAALLAAIAIANTVGPSKILTLATGLIALGTFLFSGSLYALAFTGNSFFARVAPWGGSTLILAWLLIAVSGWVMTTNTDA
jgi:uncharacterized membrane protein YgdD (TMEM256/DUF423 family)